MKRITTLTFVLALLLGGMTVSAQTKDAKKEKAQKEAIDKKKEKGEKKLKVAPPPPPAPAVKPAPVAKAAPKPATSIAKPAAQKVAPPPPPAKAAAPAVDNTGNKVIGTDDKGRTIYEGPRGGRYYINKNGHKEYIKH